MAAYQLTASPLIVLRESDSTYIGPANVTDWAAYQSWLAGPNTPDPAPTPPNPTVITFNQMWNRFTTAEQTAITTAAQTNPQLFQWMFQGASASIVNLLAPTTKTGLDYLVSLGLLASWRETAILTP